MSNGAQHRFIGLGAALLFVALPIACAALIAVNLLGLKETYGLVERQEALLAQLDARLARLNADGRATLDTTPLYLPAGSRTLAGPDLQQRLVKAIEAAGAKLIEAQELEETEGMAPDAIRMRVTLDANNEAFLSLLYAVESGLPLMTVRSMSARRLPTREGEDTADPMLRIDLVVEAHWRAAA